MPVTALVSPALAQNLVSGSPRATMTLNGQWQQVLNQDQTKIPASGWSTTRIPALPLTDGTTSVWYQQTFYIPASWVRPGRRFFVQLEKAGHYAAVYFNGAFIGDHFGQFSPFEVEVTQYVVGGKTNQVQIYVHKADTTYVQRGYNVDQSSCPTYNPDCIGNAYRTGTPMNGYIQRNWVGLVGDVTFSWSPNLHISDVFPVSSVRDWTLTATITTSGTSAGAITARATVFDGASAVLSLPSQPVVSGTATLQSPWTTPTLWGPAPYGQPKLYTLQTQLLRNGTVVDTVYTRFGFREVWIDGTDVMLNGQKLWMVGNFFSPLSPIRYINDRREQAFVLWVAENSGSNTVQSHWDDPGASWLELADEMGILVIGAYYCDGRPQIQSKLTDVSAWTSWVVSTTQEWVQARRNHPSIVMWRPMDVLPQEAMPTQGKVFAQAASAIRGLDSTRPIADGSDIDVWGQGLTVAGNPHQCDDGSTYAAKLAGETKPLLTKEIFGDAGLSCAASFFDTFYKDAYTGGGVGLVTPQAIFQDQTFTPTWFSLSGLGNRPTTPQDLPDWISQSWSPTAYSTQFAGLYQQYFQQALPNTSPMSGDYEASGLTSALARSSAFLLPAKGLGNPTGVLIAQDGSGTAWFVVPQAGSYTLVYTNGGKDVTQSVTVSAPPPF